MSITCSRHSLKAKIFNCCKVKLTYSQAISGLPTHGFYNKLLLRKMHLLAVISYEIQFTLCLPFYKFIV